jgi:hypothetical protein
MAEPNEWTVMFYFAGDNALAPVIVSQLKAIKDAGFHEKINVLVHFDPNEQGAPTRIYDVNRKRKKDPKLPNTMIGDGEDPFVRNLKEDEIQPRAISRTAGPSSLATIKALRKPDAVSAKDALINFLGFCRENHRAKHYILILVGHGMIVGNDAFLPDENPVSAITLHELDQEILRPFTKQVTDDGDAFEMLALHSCSMSALEVAYQLKGTANFMMGSEGISFVGSWPYRQMLKKTFKTIENAREAARRHAKDRNENQAEALGNPDVDIETMMEKLYFLSLFNATDFLLSGYSLDLALCSMEEQRYEPLTEVIQKLVAALKEAVRNERGQELILLAHWEAQSYWGESYTDLFDFCRCLRKRCTQNRVLPKLGKACFDVMEKLKPIKSKLVSERFKALVIHSENFGSQYQYSHGLSVYFPWSRPVENAGTGGTNKGILDIYRDYAFTKALGDDSWLSFLELYFDETKRLSRKAEDRVVKPGGREFAAALDSFNPSGPLSVSTSPFALEPGKPSPSTGLACPCASIKNYPDALEEPKKTQGKRKRKGTSKLKVKFSITEGALQAFE